MSSDAGSGGSSDVCRALIVHPEFASTPATPPAAATTSAYSSLVGSYGGSSSATTRSASGYVGLANQGATCYMNSLLQTLFMTPEFRTAMFKWRFGQINGAQEDGPCTEPTGVEAGSVDGPVEESKGQDTDAALANVAATCTNVTDIDDDPESMEESIPFQLQRLFGLLQLSTRRAAETKALTKSFGWDSRDTFQQHDVQELCRILFDKIEESFRGTEQSQMVNQLYRGTMVDFIACKQCGFERSRPDPFLDISLVIKPFGSDRLMRSVEEALGHFLKPEVLDGDNKWECERCQCKVDAFKGLKFTELPPLLALQLKRFDFDFETLGRVKIHERVSFPTVLDMNEFVAPAADPATASSADNGAAAAFLTSSFAAQAERKLSEERRVAQMPELVDAEGNPAPQDDESECSVCARGAGVGEYHANSRSGQASNSSKTRGVGSEEDKTEMDDDQRARELLQKNGQWVYELFSVLVHSGNAMGGHYFAYIKDLARKKWFKFNDSDVSQVDFLEVQSAYGGKSQWASAYMLMYRKVELELDAGTTNVDSGSSNLNHSGSGSLNTADSATSFAVSSSREAIKRHKWLWPPASHIPQYVRELVSADEDEFRRQRELDDLRRRQITLKVFLAGASEPKSVVADRRAPLSDAVKLAWESWQPTYKFGAETESVSGVDTRSGQTVMPVAIENVRLRAYTSHTGLAGQTYTGRESTSLESLQIVPWEQMLLEVRQPGEQWQAFDPQALILYVYFFDKDNTDTDTAPHGRFVDQSPRITVTMKTTSSLGELRAEVAKHVPHALKEHGTWIPSHVRLQQKRTFFSLNGKQQKHDELELPNSLTSGNETAPENDSPGPTCQPCVSSGSTSSLAAWNEKWSTGSSGDKGENRQLVRDLGLQSATKLIAEYCPDPSALPLEQSPARLACELEYFTNEFACQLKDDDSHTVHKVWFDKRRTVSELKVSFGRKLGLLTSDNDAATFRNNYRLRLYGPYGSLVTAAEEALSVCDDALKRAEKFCIEPGRPLELDEVIVKLAFLKTEFLPLSSLSIVGAALQCDTESKSKEAAPKFPAAQQLVLLSRKSATAPAASDGGEDEEVHDMGGAAALFEYDDNDSDADAAVLDESRHPQVKSATEYAMARAKAKQELRDMAAKCAAAETATSVIAEVWAEEEKETSEPGTPGSSEQVSTRPHPLATGDSNVIVENSAGVMPNPSTVAAANESSATDLHSPVLLKFSANTPSTEYVDVGELVVGPTAKLSDVLQKATLLLLEHHDECKLDLVQKALDQYNPCATNVGGDVAEQLAPYLRIRDRVLATHNGRVWRCAKTGMLHDEPHVTKKDHNITIKRAVLQFSPFYGHDNPCYKDVHLSDAVCRNAGPETFASDVKPCVGGPDLRMGHAVEPEPETCTECTVVVSNAKSCERDILLGLQWWDRKSYQLSVLHELAIKPGETLAQVGARIAALVGLRPEALEMTRPSHTRPLFYHEIPLQNWTPVLGDKCSRMFVEAISTAGAIEEGDIVFAQDTQSQLYSPNEAELSAIKASKGTTAAWSSKGLSAFAPVSDGMTSSGASGGSKSSSSRLGHLDLASATPLSANRSPTKQHKRVERGLRIRTKKERLAEQRQKTRIALEQGPQPEDSTLDFLTGDCNGPNPTAPPGSPVETFAGDDAAFDKSEGLALFDSIL